MSTDTVAEQATDTTTWQIAPAGFFSRHYDVFRDGQLVTKLRMNLWREGCHFAIAGHEFAIVRPSLWKDAFILMSGDEQLCTVTKKFWSRRFELVALDQSWSLQPASFFTRSYQLIDRSRAVGTIGPSGWFTRSRTAEFSAEVPPPIQLLAIFLVLLVNRRQHSHAD
jgi:hypothetical protein